MHSSRLYFVACSWWLVKMVRFVDIVALVRGLLQMCKWLKSAQFCARRDEKCLSPKRLKLRKKLKTSNNDENFKKLRFPTHYLASKTSKNTENYEK